MEKESKGNKYIDKITNVFKRKTNIQKPEENLKQQLEDLKIETLKSLKETEWMFDKQASSIDQSNLRAFYVDKKFEFSINK